MVRTVRHNYLNAALITAMSTNMDTDCFFGACLTVESSIISDNSGTAISNSGSVVILNSTLSGNSARQGDSGGGIKTGDFKNPGSGATIINSTISGNSASEGGGGSHLLWVLVSHQWQLSWRCGRRHHTLSFNSTISSNSAKLGGGISNCGGVELANSTLSGNSAAGSGGGIHSGGARWKSEIRSSTPAHSEKISSTTAAPSPRTAITSAAMTAAAF